MNLAALPGAPRPSLDRTATNHSRSPGGRTDDPESRKPTLNSGFPRFSA